MKKILFHDVVIFESNRRIASLSSAIRSTGYADTKVSLPDDNLDSADSIFFLTTLFAHVTPNSLTQLVFYLTHEYVTHGDKLTCQFT